MTASNAELPMPLASATPIGGGDRARVSTRARARVAATVRDGKPAAWFLQRTAVVRADVAAWWLLAAAPAPLSAWLAAQTPAEKRIPAGNTVLRGAWVGHNWTFGALTFAASVALFLAAGGLRWLAGHPARFWAAAAITAAIGMWLAFN